MKPNKNKETIFHSTSDWYRKLALIDLIKRIAELGDKRALSEFHNNRTIFQVPKKGWVCLSDYLNHLREVAAIVRWKPGNAIERADQAYDLALDKFNNLPICHTSINKSTSDHDAQVKPMGSDCRLYFKAFQNFITQKFTNTPPRDPLEEELKVAKTLQKFIKRHFFFSLLDAERNGNPFWSRYFWRVNGRKICLWMPKYIYGHQRRRWLEREIPDPDPFKSAERERIQNIINHKFAYLAFVPFDENILNPEDERFKPEEIGMEPFCKVLPQAVAEEKTANIKQQRRAIQKLSNPKLKELILKVFESLDYDNTPDCELAKEFGISKATFSRFAGSHWNRSEGNTIPDLWRNTALVLSMNPDFKDIVIAAGIWKEVQVVVGDPNKK